MSVRSGEKCEYTRKGRKYGGETREKLISWMKWLSVSREDREKLEEKRIEEVKLGVVGIGSRVI